VFYLSEENQTEPIKAGALLFGNNEENGINT
jgi:hypothetical protein